jgi:lipopolysaccharide/colanic/teichoic acid biosynthesis glycosyltransferase
MAPWEARNPFGGSQQLKTGVLYLSLDGRHAVTVGAKPAGRSHARGGGVERMLDVALIAIAAPVLCVIALAIALMIYLDSPGPVIYRSWRVGSDGERFAMLKFRKMRREANGGLLTLEDDERFTPIGRFLAATRLDELPQVINVLRGEMRLVGPRPELEYFVARYAEEYREILTVPPGLTGEAQLRFLGESALLAGPEPEAVYAEQLLPEKVAIDLEYVRTHGVRRDASIILRTAAMPISLAVGQLITHRRWLPVVSCGLALGLLFVTLGSGLA